MSFINAVQVQHKGIMRSQKKAESYKLYSCTHLTRAKINLKVDKSLAGRKKVLKYSSKPNPLLTINSAIGQTTVFLPSSRDVHKSNDLENTLNAQSQSINTYQFDAFQFSEHRNSEFVSFSSNQDNKEHQIFSNPSFSSYSHTEGAMEESESYSLDNSESDDFNYNSYETYPSRYTPNILKTKGAKVLNNITYYKESEISTSSSNNNNKKDFVQEKSSRKRKQTYNLSKIEEDSLDLHKNEEPIHAEKPFKVEGKRKREYNRKPKQEKKVKHNKKIQKEDSCARVCFFRPDLLDGKQSLKMNEPAEDIIQNCRELSEESWIDVGNYEKNPEESPLRIEDYETVSTESPLGMEEIPAEFEAGFEAFGEAYMKSQSGTVDRFMPINSEFFVPDYVDSLNTGDFIVDSDEVHKLISPTLSTDIFDMLMSDFDVEHMLDMNGNNIKMPSNSILEDLDFEATSNHSFESISIDEFRKFDSENFSDEFTNNNSFQTNSEFNESSSIKCTNLEERPFQTPQTGVKDSLINGSRPTDIFYNNENYQGYHSNVSDINFAPRNSSIYEKPHVTVEFNKFFLSCAHVECYDQKYTKENYDLHTYNNDQVPVSPKDLIFYEAAKKENILSYEDNKCVITKQNTVKKKKTNQEIARFECLECKIVFAAKRSLALHQSKAHLGTYTYKCTRCSMLCNSKSNLQRHSKNCCYVKKPFTCPICQKRYSHKSSLSQHVKTKHSVLQA